MSDNSVSRRVPWAISLLAVASLGLCAGCIVGGPRVWVEESEVLELPADGVATFAPITHNGHVVVEASASREDKIVVTVSKRAGGTDEADAHACMDAIELVSDRAGDVQHVKWRWRTPRRWNWGASVAYDVQVPPRLGIDAQTHNGRIAVTGVKGSCMVRSHNGKVKVESSAAILRVNSHNGRIEVTGKPADLLLMTHNGPIDADLEEAGTLQGRITTHNGGVRVTLSKESDLRLVCSTHNGRVSAGLHQFRDVVSKRNRLEGTLGAGSGRLIVETHNGSIEVR